VGEAETAAEVGQQLDDEIAELRQQGGGGGDAGRPVGPHVLGSGVGDRRWQRRGERESSRRLLEQRPRPGVVAGRREPRQGFEALARRLGVTQPPNGSARTVEEAVAAATRRSKELAG